MRSMLLFLLAGSLITSCVLGQAPTSGEALIRQLGDPTPPQREQAAAELRRLGKAALADLEAGLKSDDPEIRRACAELVEAIRTDRGPRIEAFLNGVDPTDPPLPGWANFKKVVGDDRLARLTFLELSKSNATFIDQLAKDPRQVANRAAELCTAIWNRQGPMPVGEKRIEQILVALIAVAIEPNLKPEAYNPFQTMLYQPDVRQLVQNDTISRRLANRVLVARSTEDLNSLLQTAYMARNLGLADYMEASLKPAILKMVNSLEDKPKDTNRLSQIVNLIQASGMADSMRLKLTPVVRKLAEAAAKSVEDGTAFTNPSVLYQASSVVSQKFVSSLAEARGVGKPA